MPALESALCAADAEPASDLPLRLLRCPRTGRALICETAGLRAAQGPLYRFGPAGIPIFAAQSISEDARRQQAHYDSIARAYEANLGYPHTRAYLEYLDEALFAAIGPAPLGSMAELCCGLGAAVELLDGRYAQAVGVDISSAMLERAARDHADRAATFVQGDATDLPLADAAFDTVVMLGGIHHINDRAALFAEVARALKPGGRFIFREPVSDFFLWRWLRAAIYRLSPMLDHDTERPLLWGETVPPLQQAGLEVTHWSTHGFLGFCVFMNSDVLFFNRFFRFIPGIAAITRAATRFDAALLSLPALSRAGLQVIGVAEKPA
jgi:ubiquinone/menaquinone biosynthesis C-methylase UbiE